MKFHFPIDFVASVLEASLQGANIMINQAVTSSQQVLQETQHVFSEVNNLTEKYKYLLTAPKNVSKIIRKGHNLGKEKIILKCNRFAKCFKQEEGGKRQK